jgi:hypothetical protein
VSLSFILYSEFFLRLAIGFYMLIFQPPVNFCSDENIQTIFGAKLEDFLNYWIDYNSISQTVEKVVKKMSKSGDRQVLVELRFSIIKGNDNGCSNISISLNLASMQVNLFDTIQTSRKIVYNSVFVTLTAFVDMSSLLIWRLKNEQ